MKKLLLLLLFPFSLSAQILEKDFVATVTYSGFTQINDSLFRGDLVKFVDALDGNVTDSVQAGFVCLDGTGKSYRVKVINSRTFSSLNVDLIEYQDLDRIPVGRGLIVERFGSTYQIPNGLVNSLGISSVLQAKIINHNVKLAATNVQPPDTLYLQELSGTTAISDGDTIPLIDYVRVVDTTIAFASYLKRPVGWGLSLLTGKYPFVDSSKVASRYYTGTNPTTIANNYVPASDGTNLVARNLFDNNTYVGILNSKPFSFGAWTLAGRPTGTANYFGWRDGTTFEWYNGTRWAAGLESTARTFTTGSLIFADANGQATQDNTNLFWNNTSKFLGIGTNSPGGGLDIRQGAAQFLYYENTNKPTFLVNRTSSSGQVRFDMAYTGSVKAGLVVNTNGEITHTAALGGYFPTFQSNGSEVMRLGTSGTMLVGTTAEVPSAVVVITSTTKGILPPRWTAANRVAISSPATGIFGYQTDGTEGLYIKAAAGFKRVLWEGDAVNTWLKPSLEAGSVNINQGRVNKLRFNQDSGYFHLKNGVIFFQHPTEKDMVNYGIPQVVITSDTSALWNLSGAVVSIGSRLGANNRTGYGYTMVGSLTQGIVNGFSGYFSSAYGYDVQIDSTIRTVSLGTKIIANRTTDCTALGSYITYRKGLNNSHAIGIEDTVDRSYSFLFGDGLNTRFAYEYMYGSKYNPKHVFVGSKLMIGLDSTFLFNTATDVLQLSAYGTSATTAATLGLTTPTYLAGFVPSGSGQGTVVSYPISSLSDGNGIYSNSGTLANHTTRALIPSTGNLLFSQTYNSTDSAYIQVINNLDGNREIRGGLTDTASTGYSTFRFYQNEADEEMGYDFRSLDNTGNTRVLAQGGNIRVIGSDVATLESAGEVRLLGLTVAKQEAYNEITSTSSPQTLSSDYPDNLINQGTTQAAFTFKLPASPEDGQISKLTFFNAVTVLTIDGNGTTVSGTLPTTASISTVIIFKNYSGIGWIRQY